MAYESKSKLLSRIELFSSVPEDVLSEIASVGATFYTPPNTPAVTQGTGSSGLHVIIEGTAEVEVNGQRRPALGPGDYFGEISVIDGAARSATIIGGEDGLKTFNVSPINFSVLIDRHPTLARSLLIALCARIRSLEATDRVADV